MEIHKQKIHGFKCFKKGLETRYGQKMELNKIYTFEGSPIFRSSGYHMCENMEDTFRYFDCFEEEVDVCKVIGYPEYQKYEDEYYGFYDMYSCQGIELVEKLIRKQIIEMADNMCDFRFIRFINLYPLTHEELEYFTNKYKKNEYVLSRILYEYYEKSSSGEMKLKNKIIKR